MKTIKQLKSPVGKYGQLKIEVDYTLGGVNYFSGNVNQRGYKLYITPCNVGDGFMQSTLMGSTDESGYYIMLEQVKRKNQKKMQEWWDKIEPLADKIAELYSERKHGEIMTLFDNESVNPKQPLTKVGPQRKEVVTPAMLADLAANTEDKFIFKLFNPVGVWFAKEVDEYRLKKGDELKAVTQYKEAFDLINDGWELDDVIIFGWVKITHGEYGSFSLKEIETYDKPMYAIEKDKYFEPTNCEEAIAKY